MCRLREYLSIALIKLVSADGSETMYRLLCPLQNPLVAGFVEVSDSQASERERPPEDVMRDASIWAHTFKVVDRSFRYSDSIEFADSGAKVLAIG